MMEYRNLGNTGLKVSVLGMGGNVFGCHAGWTHYNDEAASIELIHQAADLGINMIDTADSYSNGTSEEYIGKAVAGRRDQFVIASKVGQPVGQPPNKSGLSRAHIMNSVEGSLRRLNTDYIDLYYAHVPDPNTPLDESMRAFDDLIRKGWVRYIACSNFAGWQIAASEQVAERHNLARFAVNQASYGLLSRQIEAEVIPSCKYYGKGIIAYSVLAQGVLTGKYRGGVKEGTRAWQNPSQVLKAYLAPENLKRVDRLEDWAEQHGHRVSELAIAWAVSRPQVTAALLGFTSREQMEANVAAVEWKITPEHWTEIDQILAS